MSSEPTWPGVEHALAKAAELLTLAESVDSEQARTACYVADSWRALAVDAAGLRRDEPSVGDPRYGGSRLRQPAAPQLPLLRPGALVRIPGVDVPYVVDKGLATSGAHATLTFTTVDGRDWSDDRTVNAATDPGRKTEIGTEAGWTDVTEHVAGPLTLQAGETTEPYVCVSVTGTDPDTVAETLAKLNPRTETVNTLVRAGIDPADAVNTVALSNARLTFDFTDGRDQLGDAFVKFLRKRIRASGARSVDELLDGPDDGLAGVREPVKR